MDVLSRTIVMIFAVVLMVGFASSAFGEGNAGNRLIRKLTHTDSERLLVVAENRNWLNPDGCDKSNQVILSAGQLANNNVYRGMQAILLSAHIAGRRIEVRTNGCLGIDGATYPVVTQVTLL